MINAADTNLSQSDFKEEVQRSALAIHTECLGKETLKARNRLLIISFILFLVSFGAAAVEAIKPPESPIGFSLTIGAKWPLFFICGFFVVELVARSKTELTIWRLKNEKPMEELLTMQEVLTTAFVEKTATLSTQLNQPGLQLKELDEITKQNKPALDILESRVKYIHRVVRSAVNILKFRVWWEVIFPVLFGVAALVLVGWFTKYPFLPVAKP